MGKSKETDVTPMTVEAADQKAAGLTHDLKLSKKYFSKNDALSLLAVLEASSSCKEKEDFRVLLNYFGGLFGAEFSLCFLATLTENDVFTSFEALNASFPADWLEQYISKGYYLIDPVAVEHFRSYEVQYWKRTYRKYSPPTALLLHANRFGLKKGCSCGTRDSNGERPASLFYFSGASIEERPRTELMLRYSVPFLHAGIKRVLKVPPRSTQTILTLREKGILRCIKDGKTDTAISSCLKISEHTVKYHVKNILFKLDVSSRYHAVAIALQKNLI